MNKQIKTKNNEVIKNKEGVNEMNKDINKEFEQCVYLEIKDFIKELENDLIISHIKKIIDFELKVFMIIKDKVEKSEMEFLEIAKREIDIEKKRGVTENSINITLKNIFTERLKNKDDEGLEKIISQSIEVGVCKDCGKSFNDGYTGLGYEGNADGLSLCNSCVGRNFKVCKGCGVESEYCLMRTDKSYEDCEIYQEGQALLKEEARERYEEERDLYDLDFNNEIEAR